MKYNKVTTQPLCTNGCPLGALEKDMSVLIKVDGSMMPCQMLYSDKYKVCNILSTSQTELFDGYSIVSDMVKQRMSNDYGCNRCIVRNHCKKGCMAIAEYLFDDGQASDGECHLRRAQMVAFGLKEMVDVKNKSIETQQ